MHPYIARPDVRFAYTERFCSFARSGRCCSFVFIVTSSPITNCTASRGRSFRRLVCGGAQPFHQACVLIQHTHPARPLPLLSGTARPVACLLAPCFAQVIYQSVKGRPFGVSCMCFGVALTSDFAPDTRSTSPRHGYNSGHLVRSTGHPVRALCVKIWPSLQPHSGAQSLLKVDTFWLPCVPGVFRLLLLP